MPEIITSGLYYPNKIARIYFEAAEHTVGSEAMPDLLRASGLERYIDAYPPDNLERTFDFAEFAALTAGLDMLQVKTLGKPSMAWKTGHQSFKAGLKAYGALAGLGVMVLSLPILPLDFKIKMGLVSMATTFSSFSDQKTEVHEHNDHFTYVIHKCPMCWNRHADTAICEGAGAMLVAGLNWATERDFDVIETQCHARGDETCTFVINKPQN
jgi:predicted hydrocarbon binding protein